MKWSSTIPLVLRRLERADGKPRLSRTADFVFGLALLLAFGGCIVMAIVAFGDWR